MKILNISLEKKLFEENSKSRERVVNYAPLFERYDLIVLTKKSKQTIQSGNMQIVPTNSFSKLNYLVDAYFLGKKLIEKYKYDVISSQDPFELGFLAWLLAKRYGLKLQVQMHGDYFGSRYWLEEHFFNRLKFYLGKFLIKKADGVRVVSQRTKESLIKLGLSASKIVVIPVYAQISDKSLEIKKIKTEGKFIFLTVGRLVNVKNIALQIEAMAEILKTNPQTELWIVGDGPEKNKLKKLSQQLKISDNIKFWGWQDDLEKFYGGADAFLLTSNYEGWGVVVIEAVSFDLPIIMTDVGCAGEIIKNEESGAVIKIGDKEALTSAMLRIILDQDFNSKIVTDAKKLVLALPNLEQNLAWYKKSFEDLMK
ncbi:MAG: glycosyltransferase family 4 protein [Patescibacteria group bacterium]